MRPAGKLKLGYFPLPSDEAGRIRGFLRPPAHAVCSVGPLHWSRIGNKFAYKKGRSHERKTAATTT